MNPERAKQRAETVFWRQVVRGLVEARDGNRCRMCGERSPWMEMHHVVYLSRGGVDHPANALMLCRDHHQAVHARIEPCPMPQAGREDGVIAVIQSRDYGTREYATAPPMPGSIVTQREKLWLVGTTRFHHEPVKVVYRGV